MTCWGAGNIVESSDRSHLKVRPISSKFSLATVTENWEHPGKSPAGVQGEAECVAGFGGLGCFLHLAIPNLDQREQGLALTAIQTIYSPTSFQMTAYREK